MALVWCAATLPGLGVAHPAIVLAAAAVSSAGRKPLDPTLPPIPTPAGDIRPDLLEMVIRGPLPMAAVAAVLARMCGS